MLDAIIGQHTWFCQIRTHIHTGYTHTRTHKKKVEGLEKTKEKKSRKNPKKRGGVRKERKKKKRKDKNKRGGKIEENEKQSSSLLIVIKAIIIKIRFFEHFLERL